MDYVMDLYDFGNIISNNFILFSTIIGTAGLFTICLSSGRWVKQVINGVERLI
jgi:hypothetical protein